MTKRRRRRRYVGPSEWTFPENYDWRNRSDVPVDEAAVVGSGIVEAGGLWIGRVVPLPDGEGGGFGFRVMRTDGMPGDRMLRFSGEWPANVTRRKLIASLEHLATEEVWELIVKHGGSYEGG